MKHNKNSKNKHPYSVFKFLVILLLIGVFMFSSMYIARYVILYKNLTTNSPEESAFRSVLLDVVNFFIIVFCYVLTGLAFVYFH